jgi:hypothetical protein
MSRGLFVAIAIFWMIAAVLMFVDGLSMFAVAGTALYGVWAAWYSAQRPILADEAPTL